jgi:peptidyl-prolyl cis-trans isomerase C
MRFIYLLLCAALVAFSSQSAFAEAGNSVVATVNGINLTRAELNQEISKIMPMERNFHGGISAEKLKSIEAKAMATLVDMELQYQDGLSKGIKLDKKTLDAEEAKLVEKYPTREAYLEAVKSAGFTDQTMSRFIGRNVLSLQVKEMEVEKKLNVTDDKVVRYYEENRTKYQKPEEYKARLLLVKVPPSSNAEQRATYKKRAEELLQSIVKGADFAEVASKTSDDPTRIKGGDLGSQHFGQMDDEFEALIKKMKVGELSALQDNLQGFYFVRLEDKKAPRQIPFEEVKDKVKANLIKQEKERLFNTWMAALREKAKIVYPAAEKADKEKPN